MKSRFDCIRVVRQSRKDHQCSWCGERILRGHQYARHTGIYDGDFMVTKLHPECYEATGLALTKLGSIEWTDRQPRGAVNWDTIGEAQ